MNLEDLIKMSKEAVRQSMPKAEEVSGYTQEQIDKMADEITVAAIKFQDLKTTLPLAISSVLRILRVLTAKPAPIFSMR